MAVVKINAITVPAGERDEVERRFAAHQASLDGTPGYLGFELLRPTGGDERYFVYTRWESDEAFQRWRGDKSDSAHGGGEQSPATGAELLEFDLVVSSVTTPDAP